MPNVNPVPEGLGTVTPHLVISNASQAIEFYKNAFGAEEICRMPGPDGNGVMHAEIKIGESMLMIADEMPQPGGLKSPKTLNGTTVNLCLFVPDCDKVYEQAIGAGAAPIMPPADMFWGDRYSKVTDPYGHEWAIATHLKDMTPDEIGQAAEAFFSQMGGCEQ